jgi:hypothetical protein
MAGGSLVSLPNGISNSLLTAAATMKPLVQTPASKDHWMLSNDQGECIIYNHAASTVEIDLSKKAGAFRLQRIDPATSLVIQAEEDVKGGQVIHIEVKENKPVVFWVSRVAALNTSTN